MSATRVLSVVVRPRVLRECVSMSNSIFTVFLYALTQFSTNVVPGTGSAVLLSSENENDYGAAEHLLDVVVFADLRHFDAAAQRVSRSVGSVICRA